VLVTMRCVHKLFFYIYIYIYIQYILHFSRYGRIFTKICWESTDCIQLAWDKGHWRALVSRIMNSRVPEGRGIS
jgi:hypothetical protein